MAALDIKTEVFSNPQYKLLRLTVTEQDKPVQGAAVVGTAATMPDSTWPAQFPTDADGKTEIMVALDRVPTGTTVHLEATAPNAFGGADVAVS